MVSLLSASRSASHSSLRHVISKLSLSGASDASENLLKVKAPSASSSASSSQLSLNGNDEENLTVKITPMLQKQEPTPRHSSEDIRLLAVSTHMTELSYGISDVQTRIFEIQELRHSSQSLTDGKTSSSVIDQALSALDAKLETLNQGMRSVDEVMKPFIDKNTTPKDSVYPIEAGFMSDETQALLRKHADLTSEWDSVLDESAVLREELKEDKWLTVFRTVNEQADGMMSSLEKAVKKCQEFIWQVHQRETSEDSLMSPVSPNTPAKPLVDYDTFSTLLSSYEAKKKHYIPATSKVLSIIDKGVQDRVTKNGECLRRHAESTQRWKTLRERIAHTDTEMERVRKIFVKGDMTPSESGSTTSAKTSKSNKSKTGHLLTPPSSGSLRNRTSSAGGSLSRSMSPFRRLAKKITSGAKTPGRQTPTQAATMKRGKSAPTSEPMPILRHRASLLGLRQVSQQSVTPDRPSHKHSQSFTPESPTAARVHAAAANASSMRAMPIRWNSSTKLEDDGYMTAKPVPSRPSISNPGSVYSPPPTHTMRSPSRSSIASSRPWSPLTSSLNSSMTSTTSRISSTTGASRPPSRGSPGTVASRIKRSPPSAASTRTYNTSNYSTLTFDDESETSTSIMQRAISPTFSISGVSAISHSFRTHTPGGTRIPHPRPPSRSMIPIPSVHVNGASRPPSAMSVYDRAGTSMSIRSMATRAQTPETTLRKRASQIPFYPDGPKTVPRRLPSQITAPPSSFRDGLPVTTSRPPSRSAASIAGLEGDPVHKYVVSNPKDPLDVELGSIVNSMPHGLLVERVDPPLRGAPTAGAELKAQYAFTNAVARKVVTCKLTTMTRSGPKGQSTTKKIMVRVGGGWQDLPMYMLNRQAGV